MAWGPRIPALGIYPTVESLGAQALLLALALLALVWNFVLEPRRARGVTSVMVPEGRAVGSSPPASRTSPPPRASGETVAVSAVVELTRSLERMEADLAEMRAEVERMRRHLASDAAVSVRRPRR